MTGRVPSEPGSRPADQAPSGLAAPRFDPSRDASPDDADTLIRGMSAAQRRDLEAVCRTSGGGVRVRCRINDEGYGEPTSGPMKKLFDKGLIQGKSGAYETVVHTRLGLSVWRRLRDSDRSAEGGETREASGSTEGESAGRSDSEGIAQNTPGAA